MACNLLSGCNNEVFRNLDYCALHCEKNSHKIDAESGLLAEFNNMLNRHIIDDVLSKKLPGIREPYFISQLKECKNKKIPIHKIIKCRGNFSDRLLFLEYIKFPAGELMDYLENLKIFKGVRFSECSFKSSEFDLELTPVYFKSCFFKSDFQIKKSVLYKIEKDCIFYKCTFEDKVYVDLKDEVKEDRLFKYTLFEECCFEGVVSLSNAEFEKEVFKFKPVPNIDTEVSAPDCLSSILINDVVFHDKCKFNYIDVVNLVIKDTKFLSKLEVKNSIVSYFELNNSNVSEVFDSFDSRFIRFVFYKSIFTDFSGFEKVYFGLEDNFDDLYAAKFIYTTFMSFSNFRSTKFLSGLDFENSNLKEQPNFLKAYINPINTNRETFRIVKNSFDDVGNKLEANKFFAEEMKAYKKELDYIKFKEIEYIKSIKENGKNVKYKKTKNYKESRRSRWVFNANNFISEFGENYLRPTFILTISVAVYTVITLWNKHYFKEHPYFTSWDWLNNASWSKWYFESHEYFLSCEGFDIFSGFWNELAINILPFRVFIKDRNGIEFISLFFYIWFAILIWQIIIAVKRHTQR